MGAEMGEGLAEHEARVARLMDRYEALNRAQPTGNANHVSTVLNLGGAGLLLGALIGVLGVWAAIDARREARADARIMAAERKADLRELSTLKRDVATIQAYTTLHGQKITKLEANDGEHPER